MEHHVDNNDHEYTQPVPFEEFIPFGDRKNLNEWICAGKSVYGHYASSLLIDEVSDSNGEAIAYIPTFLVGGTQGVTLWYLWKSLSPVRGNSSVCLNEPIFTVAIIGIFLLYLLRSFEDIFIDYKIWSSAIEVYAYIPSKGNVRCATTDSPCGRVVSLLVIGYELLIWVCVLLVGILYIFSS